VDGAVIVFFIAMAILLAVAIAIAISRGRTIDEIRGLTEERAPGDEPVGQVRRILAEADAASLELERARRELAYLIEIIGVGIVEIGDDRRIVAANATAHALLDRTAGSLRGLTITGAFLDSRIDAIVETAREAGAASGEVRLRPDAAMLVVRVRRSPVSGLWLVLEDVSELRRLQQIRAEFIDNLSHELRTPLTTVSLLAETLTREAETAGDAIPARMRDRIAKIEVETGHIVQMVNELLDLSRIESGGSLGVLDWVDMGPLAIASVERLRLFAERQGVVLRTERDEGLPLVRGDEGRLGQVLVNLLHNAVKFSPDGSEVVVRVAVLEGEVVTSVIDHGVGVPQAAQARIFERFYKVDRARVRGEASGTGLGLAISRHVIEQHGGRIWVESEEGVGSTFSFALPIADPPH
jgi:two-component system, OmpR family, phosphate regulon sensor histidine kinase PhoR